MYPIPTGGGHSTFWPPAGKTKEEPGPAETGGAAVWRPVVMWRGSNRRLRGDIVRRQYH